MSFGLAAGRLHWWITASALVAFGLTTWLVGRFVSAAGDHISHGL